MGLVGETSSSVQVICLHYLCLWNKPTREQRDGFFSRTVKLSPGNIWSAEFLRHEPHCKANASGKYSSITWTNKSVKFLRLILSGLDQRTLHSTTAGQQFIHDGSGWATPAENARLRLRSMRITCRTSWREKRTAFRATRRKRPCSKKIKI